MAIMRHGPIGFIRSLWRSEKKVEQGGDWLERFSFVSVEDGCVRVDVQEAIDRFCWPDTPEFREKVLKAAIEAAHEVFPELPVMLETTQDDEADQAQKVRGR